MRPVFDEVTATIHHFIETLPLVGTQAGENHQVMRGHQYIDEIELQKSEPVDDSSYVRPVRDCRSSAVEALRCQGDAAGLRTGKSNSTHRSVALCL